MRRSNRIALSVLLLAGMTIAKSAFAATLYNFEVSEPATSTTFTFSLMSTPTVTSSSSTYFEIANVPISYDSGSPVDGNLFFLVTPSGLYLDQSLSPFEMIYDEESSPAMFTGSTSDPTFNTGTFQGIDDSDTSDKVYLYISPAGAAAPEPASLMLLGTGLLGLAGVARRRFTV